MSNQPAKASGRKKGQTTRLVGPLGMVMVLAAGFGLASLATSRDGDGDPLTSRFTVAEISSLDIPLSSLDVGAAMTNSAAAASETLQISTPSTLDLQSLPRPVPKPTAALRARLAAGKPVFVGPKRLPIPVKKPAWIGRRS